MGYNTKMKHLTNLFKLMQLTRSQPLYGYVIGGVQKNDLSNLAEHHYLVTFIAWQLARQVKSKGANINVEKVLEFAMVHDIGELFGGYISMPYARANPKAREYAKAFEEENQKFLSKFFGSEEAYFKKLGHEILDAKSDEALIAKIADYLEHIHYKQYIKVISQKTDIDSLRPVLKLKISKIKDPVAKKEIDKFTKDWLKNVSKKEIPEILYNTKGK